MSEADRAEVAALVQDLVDGRAGGRAPRRALYRPARLGKAGLGAGVDRDAPRESLLLAQVAEAVAQLRLEVQERLNQESEARQQLAAQLQRLLRQGGEGSPPGGQGEGGEPGSMVMHQIPGIAPAGSPDPAPGPGPGGPGPEGAPAAPPSGGEEVRYGDPGGRGGGQESGAKTGAGGSNHHASQDPNTVHKLAQANFDLAEALNENLRNLKEIVDRSHELVARIESILRRHFRGRQGA